MRAELLIILALVGCGAEKDSRFGFSADSSLDVDATANDDATDDWRAPSQVDAGEDAPTPPDAGTPPTVDCINDGSVCPPHDPHCESDLWLVNYMPLTCTSGRCTYALRFEYCAPPTLVCESTDGLTDPIAFCYYGGD